MCQVSLYMYKQCGCSGCLSYHGYVASDVVCHNVSEAKLSSDMQAVQTWHGGGREGGRDDECVNVRVMSVCVCVCVYCVCEYPLHPGSLGWLHISGAV